MNDAERLAQIAQQSPLDRSYNQLVKQLEDVAAISGARKYPVNILKHKFFEEQVAAQGGTKADDIKADDMYKTQHELIDKLKANGFKVTEEKPSNIITLDKMSADPRERQQQEFDKLYLETTFWVEW